MTEECSINRYELQILNLTLRQQHSVEWISGGRLRLNDSHGVLLIDSNDLDSKTPNQLG